MLLTFVNEKWRFWKRWRPKKNISIWSSVRWQLQTTRWPEWPHRVRPFKKVVRWLLKIISKTRGWIALMRYVACKPYDILWSKKTCCPKEPVRQRNNVYRCCSHLVTEKNRFSTTQNKVEREFKPKRYLRPINYQSFGGTFAAKNAQGSAGQTSENIIL